jgi:hypothetical protein
MLAGSLIAEAITAMPHTSKGWLQLAAAVPASICFLVGTVLICAGRATLSREMLDPHEFAAFTSWDAHGYVLLTVSVAVVVVAAACGLFTWREVIIGMLIALAVVWIFTAMGWQVVHVLEPEKAADAVQAEKIRVLAERLRAWWTRATFVVGVITFALLGMILVTRKRRNS